MHSQPSRVQVCASVDTCAGRSQQLAGDNGWGACGVQNSMNLAPPIVEDPNGRKFSKYLPPQAEAKIEKKATVGLVRSRACCIVRVSVEAAAC